MIDALMDLTPRQRIWSPKCQFQKQKNPPSVESGAGDRLLGTGFVCRQSAAVLRFLPLSLASLLSFACSAQVEARHGTPATPAAVVVPSTVNATGSTRYVAPLLDPAKLDTLKGDRAANARLRKICYWLAAARNSGEEPADVIEQAQRATGYAGTARAKADAESLLRNLTILERLGCLDAANMAKLRRGYAPTITRGPYAGDVAEVDHIIPRAVVPELDEKLFNLEFMPRTMNRKKSAAIGQRQVALAKEWHAAGLLSDTCLERVISLPALNIGQPPGGQFP